MSLWNDNNENMTTSGFQCTLEVMYDRNVKLPEWREGEGVMTCDRVKESSQFPRDWFTCLNFTFAECYFNSWLQEKYNQSFQILFLMCWTHTSHIQSVFAGGFLQAADDRETPTEGSGGASCLWSYRRQTSQQGCQSHGWYGCISGQVIHCMCAGSDALKVTRGVLEQIHWWFKGWKGLKIFFLLQWTMLHNFLLNSFDHFSLEITCAVFVCPPITGVKWAGLNCEKGWCPIPVRIEIRIR